MHVISLFMYTNDSCLLSDVYCALEVDEYGRFYRKARTSFGTTSNETDIKWDEVCMWLVLRISLAFSKWNEACIDDHLYIMTICPQ